MPLKATKDYPHAAWVGETSPNEITNGRRTSLDLIVVPVVVPINNEVKHPAGPTEKLQNMSRVGETFT